MFKCFVCFVGILLLAGLFDSQEGLAHTFGDEGPISPSDDAPCPDADGEAKSSQPWTAESLANPEDGEHDGSNASKSLLRARPLFYLILSGNTLMSATHPGATTFFDTADFIYERSKNGPNLVQLRVSGQVAWVAHQNIDVLVEFGYWQDQLRSHYETIDCFDLGAGVRYNPWHWLGKGSEGRLVYTSIGLVAAFGVAFPTFTVNDVHSGQATPFGRLGIDVQLESGFVVTKLFVDYTLVDHQHAFEGGLAHPLGGLGLGFGIGVAIPR